VGWSIAGFGLFQFPASVVVVVVVVSAEWSQFRDGGPVGLGPGGLVVEVALGRVESTARIDTGWIPDFHDPFLGGGGSSLGGDDPDRMPVLVDGDDPPFGIGCFVDDLAGDIGDDRSKPGDFSGLVVDSGHGGHVDPDVDHTTVSSGNLLDVLVSAVEQVQEDVGSDLVDGSSVTFGFQSSGETVDPSHGRIGVGGREI